MLILKKTIFIDKQLQREKKAGDDVKMVQENLGNHTAAFKLDVYGHVTERMRKESSQIMEGFFNEVIKM